MGGCRSTIALRAVPLDRHLEAVYGHRLDVSRAGRKDLNPQWEEERLMVDLRVRQYVDTHEPPAQAAQALLRHELRRGLTQEHVRLLWGNPDERHAVDQEADGWWDTVWQYHTQPRTWPTRPYALYFRDGVLERILGSPNH